MKNKLRLSVLAAFTLIGSVTFGQSVNFNAGFTASSFISPDFQTETNTFTNSEGVYTSSYIYNSVGGMNIAVGFEAKLNNRLSLETGLKLQNRGYKANYLSSFEGQSEAYTQETFQRVRLNYLDIPVVLNIGILTGDVKVYVRTGLYAGFLLGGQFKTRSDYNSNDGTHEFWETTSKFDASNYEIDERIATGLIVGAGVEFKRFYFETNYNFGVFSIQDIGDNYFTSDISFSLGYKLKFND